MSSLVAFFAVATLGFGLLVQLNDFLISFTDDLADLRGLFLVDSMIKFVQQIATAGLASPSNASQELCKSPIVANLIGDEQVYATRELGLEVEASSLFLIDERHGHWL